MKLHWVVVSILLFLLAPVAQLVEAAVSKTVYVWVRLPPGAWEVAIDY